MALSRRPYVTWYGLALTRSDGRIGWRVKYGKWGNMRREDNPDNLE